MKIDGILLEVIGNTFMSIAEEMGAVLKAGRKSQFKNGYYHFTHKNCTKEKSGGCQNCLYIQRICFNTQV